MKTYAVTGCFSGIGQATAAQLETAGHRVIGVDIRDAEITADLTEPGGRQKAIEAIQGLAGDGLDGIVLAAGLGGLNEDESKVLNLNYFGSVELLDALKPQMMVRPGASAVLISSNASQFTDQYDSPTVAALLSGDVEASHAAYAVEEGVTAYGLTKHAVVRAMRQRAPQWGTDGVRLNAVVPGMTQTPLMDAVLENPETKEMVNFIPNPMQRMADPKEISEAICFLLSDKASYVHGSVLWVDGGCDAAVRPDRF